MLFSVISIWRIFPVVSTAPPLIFPVTRRITRKAGCKEFKIWPPSLKCCISRFQISIGKKTKYKAKMKGKNEIHTMNTRSGIRVIAPLILELGNGFR